MRELHVAFANAAAIWDQSIGTVPDALKSNALCVESVRSCRVATCSEERFREDVGGSWISSR